MLFDYLKKYYPEFEAGKIKKEVVFKKVFCRGKYNDLYLRVTMSRFLSSHRN